MFLVGKLIFNCGNLVILNVQFCPIESSTILHGHLIFPTPTFSVVIYYSRSESREASLGIASDLSRTDPSASSTSFLRLPRPSSRTRGRPDLTIGHSAKIVKGPRVCSTGRIPLTAGLRSYLTLPLVHKRFINNVWTVYLYGRAHTRCIVLSAKWAVEGA